MSAPQPVDRRIRLAALGLFLLPLLLYGRSVTFDAINFDDPLYIFDNPLVTGGWTGELWREIWLGREPVPLWIPLTWLSLKLDWTLFGAFPGGFHLVNVLLHAANGVLLFLWLWRLFPARPDAALLGAALFVVHPQHVESVLWLTERKEVLAGLFGLAALHGYLSHVRSGRRWGGPLVLAVAGLALSLMAKPMWITLPVLLLLLDRWPLDRRLPLGTLLLEKLPFLLLGGLCALLTVGRYGDYLIPTDRLGLGERLGHFLVTLPEYLKTFFWPVRLTPLYPFQETALPLSQLAGAAGLVLLLTGLAWGLRHRCPALLVGWAWLVIGLVPVSGLVRNGMQSMADRYTYMPHLGLLLLSTGLLVRVQRPLWRRTAPLAAGGALLLCLPLAHGQAGHWRDGVSLWCQALTVTPEAHYSHWLLGGALLQRGEVAQARRHYEQAHRLAPAQAEYRVSLGNVRLLDGDHAGAEAIFDLALGDQPRDAALLNGVAMAWMREGDFARAAALFDRARTGSGPRAARERAEARFHLGLARVALGQRDQGLADLAGALRDHPLHRGGWCALLRGAVGHAWPALAPVEERYCGRPTSPSTAGSRFPASTITLLDGRGIPPPSTAGSRFPASTVTLSEVRL
ncbi:MAG: tetratricopeptide repeat protein [Magnetococcales bacterium]|nr:tetratricopeptide repeat protein [Magnetococcales bacterium]